MKTTQIDAQAVQIKNEIAKEISPSFDHLEAESEQMFQQIFEDTQISESERTLIDQLIHGENTPEDALAILDQLIASCDDTHPYISYYHFIKGMAIEVLLDQQFPLDKFQYLDF